MKPLISIRDLLGLARGVLFLLLSCAPVSLVAHVGSPNVFFEGQAGTYPVRVIIRPPAVLPGMAQLDVRVEGATNVLVQAALWEAGTNRAPDSVLATSVAGEPNLFNAGVRLFYSGAYRVHVTVQGRHGTGEAVVPLTSAALKTPTMQVSTRILLVALGLILFAGAVWFARAVARDALLPGGAAPLERDRRRAHWVATSVALLLVFAVHAGKVRWQKMDAEFRNNELSKPQPVSASMRTTGNLRTLQLSPEKDALGALAWDTLVADHGKLMHLFLLREPDFNAFAHLHPVRRSAQSFENILPPLPAGQYRLYGEITRENGSSETVTANVTLPEPLGRAPQMLGSNMNEVICQSPVPVAASAAEPFALDADDAWHIEMGGAVAPGARVSRLMSGLQMKFQNDDALVENRDTSLRFAVFDAERRPVVLQPYMGMTGHAVVRRSDGAVFTHLHPVGTISMAAQALFTRSETNAPSNLSQKHGETAANVVSFPYAFPRAGHYRIWVQVRINGRVLTGVFDEIVKPAL
jgi:hypothetical protein